VRRKLAGSDDGDRQMVAILSAVLTDGLSAVESACAQAVSDGVHSSDVILNIVARQRDSGPVSTLLTRDALILRHALLADCARYDQIEERLSMERTGVLAMMGELRLYGMKNAYDELLATAVKRQHEPQRFAGDLLKAEISEKHARSIKWQSAIAKLPLAKDINGFDFYGTLINEALVRDLAGGDFIAQQHNAVLVGGTGAGKTHLAIAIGRACIRSGSRGRFFNTVDLVNKLKAEALGTTGTYCRSAHPHRLRDPRRTRLPAVRADRRAAAVSRDQPSL
jgi:hypothetical protein